MAANVLLKIAHVVSGKPIEAQRVSVAKSIPGDNEAMQEETGRKLTVDTPRAISRRTFIRGVIMSGAAAYPPK
jgi:hypothetical protein